MSLLDTDDVRTSAIESAISFQAFIIASRNSRVLQLLCCCYTVFCTKRPQSFINFSLGADKYFEKQNSIAVMKSFATIVLAINFIVFFCFHYFSIINFNFLMYFSYFQEFLTHFLGFFDGDFVVGRPEPRVHDVQSKSDPH